MFQRDGRYGDFNEVICQLFEPDAGNPSFIMNADFTPSRPMRVPLDIVKSCEEHETFAANVTPQFSVVQPHVDQIQEGIIDCCRAVKIVVLWPFSEHNDRVLRRCRNDRDGLFHHLADFEAPLLTVVDDTWSCYLPAGTIHATYTVVGGVLTGLNWVHSENYRISCRIMRYELEMDLETSWDGLLWLFVAQLEASLNAPHVEHVSTFVLREWIPLASRIQKHMTSGRFTGIASSLLACLRRHVEHASLGSTEAEAIRKTLTSLSARRRR